MQTRSAPRFLPSGDAALVVEFGNQVDPEISGLVLTLAHKIEAAAWPGLIEVVPTFRSLLIYYDPLTLPQSELKKNIQPLLQGLSATERTGRRWRLPACYDEEMGLDLAEVAARVGMRVPDLIALHSSATFHVYMMGFLPGFPYLGGLPSALELPRRENPRVKVPRGSVAIAMAMTCIYTLESPGGWHVLARTPIPLWDLRREPPAVLAAGDQIVFAPVSLREFEELQARAGVGEFVLRPDPTEAACA
jgi:KipI family sensor histidine kinase inhibitor